MTPEQWNKLIIAIVVVASMVLISWGHWKIKRKTKSPVRDCMNHYKLLAGSINKATWYEARFFESQIQDFAEQFADKVPKSILDFFIDDLYTLHNKRLSVTRPSVEGKKIFRTDS